MGRGLGVGGTRGVLVAVAVAVGVGEAGVTDGVGVGVGLGAPQGLTGQLKISVEACRNDSTVVAACQPDVIGAVGIRGSVPPGDGEGLAN